MKAQLHIQMHQFQSPSVATQRAVTSKPAAIPTIEKCSKEEVLAYQFPDLLERFEDKLHLSPDDASLLFRDLMQFLFVCGTHHGEGPLGPPSKIDDGWHEFVLHTKQYADFCHTHFGAFIHHVPFNRAKKTLRQGPLNALRTVDLACQEFGELSPNWTVDTSSCGKCNSCDGDCCPLHD